MLASIRAAPTLSILCLGWPWLYHVNDLLLRFNWLLLLLKLLHLLLLHILCCPHQSSGALLHMSQ
jgi:hypothetical protein